MTAGNQLFNGWWQQAAAQGIAVTVSSGDSGAAGCDHHSSALTASTGRYIPESTWNDSVVTDALLARDAPFSNTQGNANILASSGGASSCSINADNATTSTIA